MDDHSLRLSYHGLNTAQSMIRDATESDLPIIAEGMVRLQQLHVDAYPNIYKPFDESEAISYLSGLLSKTDFSVRVAIHENRPVGHAVLAVESTSPSMFKHAQRYGHVTQIEVEPDLRGSGIGKRLLQDIDELAVRLDLDRVLLDVWAFNDSARAFFLARGYNAFGSKLTRAITPDSV